MRVAASVLGAAALIAAPTAWPASSAPATCSRAAAQAAIAQTKPRLALTGDKVLISPDQADLVLCFDATGDGRIDMAVSLASGGTAGEVGWLLFVPNAAHWNGSRLVVARAWHTKSFR